jgi:hypothetical protein
VISKYLGCVCVPQRCHATTLAWFADEYPVIKFGPNYRRVHADDQAWNEIFFKNGYIEATGNVVRKPTVRPTR